MDWRRRSGVLEWACVGDEVAGGAGVDNSKRLRRMKKRSGL